MPGRYDCRVMFIVESGGSEVDETDVRSPHALEDVSARVAADVVIRIDEQNVFRFQVGVREFDLPVQKVNGVTKLVRDMTDLIQRVRMKRVVLHEVEHGHAEQVESDANVTVVIEPVQHADAKEFASRIGRR